MNKVRRRRAEGNRPVLEEPHSVPVAACCRVERARLRRRSHVADGDSRDSVVVLGPGRLAGVQGVTPLQEVCAASAISDGSEDPRGPARGARRHVDPSHQVVPDRAACCRVVVDDAQAIPPGPDGGRRRGDPRRGVRHRDRARGPGEIREVGLVDDRPVRIHEAVDVQAHMLRRALVVLLHIDREGALVIGRGDLSKRAEGRVRGIELRPRRRDLHRPERQLGVRGVRS